MAIESEIDRLRGEEVHIEMRARERESRLRRAMVQLQHEQEAHSSAARPRVLQPAKTGPATNTLRFGSAVEDLGLVCIEEPLDAYDADENGTLDPVYYWDLNAIYIWDDQIEFFAGIQNLADEQPPVIGFRAGGDSNTNIPLFDPLGRRFFGGITINF